MSEQKKCRMLLHGLETYILDHFVIRHLQDIIISQFMKPFETNDMTCKTLSLGIQ